MEKLFEQLLKKIVTREDLVLLLEEIDLAKELSFKREGIPLSEKTREKVSEEFQNYLEFLEKEGVVGKNLEKDRLFFEKLKYYFLKLPQISIEIAFLPKQAFLEKISSWLEKNFGEKIILNIVVNPEIVGGAKIEYKGKYFDFSLIRKLNELLSKNSL